MAQNGVTWIVAADGSHLRVFEEKKRFGALRELPAQAMRQAPADRGGAMAAAGALNERHGHGRYGDRNGATPVQEAEARFLAQVVERLHAEVQRRAFERLVIMAPPTALGLLRAGLTAQLSARLETTDPHNRLADDAEAIRAHLRQARERA